MCQHACLVHDTAPKHSCHHCLLLLHRSRMCPPSAALAKTTQAAKPATPPTATHPARQSATQCSLHCTASLTAWMGALRSSSHLGTAGKCAHPPVARLHARMLDRAGMHAAVHAPDCSPAHGTAATPAGARPLSSCAPCWARAEVSTEAPHRGRLQRQHSCSPGGQRPTPSHTGAMPGCHLLLPLLDAVASLHT